MVLYFCLLLSTNNSHVRPPSPLTPSLQARHTGIKIIQQIAILMGCAVLPHLKSMVDIIKHGLTDENQKVKTITALSLAGACIRVCARVCLCVHVLVCMYSGTESDRGLLCLHPSSCAAAAPVYRNAPRTSTVFSCMAWGSPPFAAMLTGAAWSMCVFYHQLPPPSLPMRLHSLPRAAQP